MICCFTTYADYTIKNISNICKYPHHIKEKKKTDHSTYISIPCLGTDPC